MTLGNPKSGAAQSVVETEQRIKAMPSAAPMTFAGVRLSHPDKILFPEQGLTKATLVGYYEAVASRMLPLIVDRPLSLVRCPQGRGRKCFFQKHDNGGFPRGIRRVTIKEGAGAIRTYFFITDLAGLVA